MQSILRRTTLLVAAAVLAAGAVGGTAVAARPHFDSASASIPGPVESAPGTGSWDAGLTVAFQVAGLGKNQGVTATLAANSAIRAFGCPGTGLLNITQDFPATGTAAFINAGVCVDLASDIEQVPVDAPTLSSNKNGQVTGSLTLPIQIDFSNLPNLCLQVLWNQITLTVGTLSVNLPDVNGQYDASGSACS